MFTGNGTKFNSDFKLSNLSESTRNSFLDAIKDDKKLDRTGFLNRVVNSIKNNREAFTAEIFNLPIELVQLISTELVKES